MSIRTKDEIRRAIGSTVLILLFALAPHAQSVSQPAGQEPAGRLVGLVLDSNKARIAGANLLVEGAGIRKELVAREDGAYEFNLPAGDYLLTISCRWRERR